MCVNLRLNFSQAQEKQLTGLGTMTQAGTTVRASTGGIRKMATSKKVASKASKILTDGRFSKTSKSVAGSALAGKKKAKRK